MVKLFILCPGGCKYAHVRTPAATWILFIEMESWNDQRRTIDDLRMISHVYKMLWVF